MKRTPLGTLGSLADHVHPGVLVTGLVHLDQFPVLGEHVVHHIDHLAHHPQDPRPAVGPATNA